MTRFKSNLFLPSIVLASATIAYADQSPKAREVLSKANAAARLITAISYEGQYSVDGDLAGKLPQVVGKVVAVRGEDGKPPRVFIQGTMQLPSQAEPMPFRFASDGQNAAKADDQHKVFQSGPVSDARVSEVAALFPPKFFGDAFQNELSSPSATHEGVQTIDGVECDVINVTFDPRGLRAIRYCIGKADHLLHRAENSIRLTMPGAAQSSAGRIIFTARNLNTKPSIDPNMFRLASPQGYRQEVFQNGFNKVPQNQQGLLASGVKAPDWELKTADGRTVSLKSLRGKVVVMDFWASWCGPCKLAMPGMQKVHEKFKDKPVTIVGINCRERSPAGEAAGLEFVQKKGLTYTQLMKGDSVAQAYLVQGIPCFYVIGPDGKVVYATSGFQPALHDYLSKIIEQSLPEGPSAAATGGAVPSPGK